MNINNRGVIYLFIVLAAAGLWQFSSGVRTVDVLGLFASGVLAGIAISNLFGYRL